MGGLWKRGWESCGSTNKGCGNAHGKPEERIGGRKERIDGRSGIDAQISDGRGAGEDGVDS